MAEQFTFRQRRFQELLAVSQAERPEGWQTKEEIASKLGVTLTTLQAWTLLPGWWSRIERIVAPVIGARLREIYSAMAEQAIGGSVQAAKFCRETLGLHKQEIDVTVRREDDRLVVIVPKIIKPPTPEIYGEDAFAIV